MDHFERLLGHDQWMATKYLEMSRGLSDEQLDQEFDIGHGTLWKTFDHMILNVDFWRSLMAGQPIDYNEPREDLSVTAMMERHQRSYAWFETTAASPRGDGSGADDHHLPNAGCWASLVPWENVLPSSPVVFPRRLWPASDEHRPLALQCHCHV